MSSTPRQYSIVSLTQEFKDFLESQSYAGGDDSLLDEDAFVYLGEVPNLPGRCVILGTLSSQVFIGVLIKNLVELTESEVQEVPFLVLLDGEDRGFL